MKPKTKQHVCVDEKGRLLVPPEVARQQGLTPGAQVSIDRRSVGLGLRPAINRLAKVYIEPTNRCNLDCRTCMRNVWDEPLGRMKKATFKGIVEGLHSVSSAPLVFFGGLGEPLMHPDIVDMVAKAKALGGTVELITNGTLLTRTMSEKLINAGLDMLWVSLDGATPESYGDVRLGATLPGVLENLRGFHEERLNRNMCLDCRRADAYNAYDRPYIGIVFVAMKRNIDDLPVLLEMCSRFAVSRFMVSNVLPYSEDMCAESLYHLALTDTNPIARLELPRMDVNRITGEALSRAVRAGYGLSIGGADPLQSANRCPFIHAGATAISWDGNVSPCVPLLHSHVRFVNERRHSCRRYVVGNVNERPLDELWMDPQYLDFRERVQLFEFSPCSSCGGCDLSEDNEADCAGNTFPTCGMCPWAQGVVQCP
jgi:MoaA/NifB/PqqE/SkfB family radical SAM enzyme